MKTSTKVILIVVGVFGGMAMLVFLLFTIGMITSAKEYEPMTPEEKIAAAERRKINKEKNDAAFHAQRFVKNKLKAPSTAKFPATQLAQVSRTNQGTYIVTSYVDSQNGFGAMIRTDYVAEIKYLPSEQVQLVNIYFDE